MSANAMSQDPKPGRCRGGSRPGGGALTLTQFPCISRSLPSELPAHPGPCGDKATGKQGHRRDRRGLVRGHSSNTPGPSGGRSRKA